jgi:TetR/AcrR family transcriptional regulator, transcriptional repressor for nem operon
VFKCDLRPSGLIQRCYQGAQRRANASRNHSQGSASVRSKGYEGAALSDLMEATGLEKGGIYRHFDSKEELAREAFDHAWKLVMETRFEGIDDIPNGVDRLRQFLRNFKERLGLVPGVCPLLNTAIESDDGNLQLRNKARYALRSWLDRLQSIVEEGQRKAKSLPILTPGKSRHSSFLRLRAA